MYGAFSGLVVTLITYTCRITQNSHANVHIMQYNAKNKQVVNLQSSDNRKLFQSKCDDDAK